VEESGLNYNQVFQLQMRETIRAYVRELAGWDEQVARDAHLAAIHLIERAKDDPELADDLLASEPVDLDALINGSPTKTRIEADPTEESP
jgi:hypothetical protein